MKLVVNDSEFENQVDKIIEITKEVNTAALETKSVLESILADSIVDKYISESVEAKMKKITSYAENVVAISDKDKTNVSNFLDYVSELDAKLD